MDRYVIQGCACHNGNCGPYDSHVENIYQIAFLLKEAILEPG
jgi:hypothetical protein